MKRAVFLGLLLFMTAGVYGQGYFKIKDRQFYDENGQVFYPVAMTYVLNLTHNGPKNPTPSPTDLATNFYFAPNFHYGEVNDFECNSISSCTTEIAKDILKLKSLGFNTIHLTFRIGWNFPGSLKQDKFYVQAYQNCGDIDACWDEHNFVEITKDPVFLYVNEPVLNFLIAQMDMVIALITSPPLNMKVMLEIAKGGSLIDPLSSHADDYTDLLKYVAAHYSTNTQLICYNTTSEPTWSENNYVPKKKVCDWTTSWYDALKQADPNHLICTKGYVDEVIYWDPAVIKADFYGVHSYPFFKDYEKNTPGYDALQAALDRFKGQLYWFRNHCPKPVIIGETGFRASDFSNPVYQALYPGNLQNPHYYDGNISQQFDYGEQTLQNAMDCECMGYSWWGFQDDWNWKEVGFGLIHHGLMTDPPNTTYDKPVSSVFAALPAANTANCTPPANYLDPFNCGMFNTNHTNAVTGTLKDADGNPIKGGVVQALNWLYIDLNQQQNPYIQSWLYFYADDNGDFEAIPYNDSMPNQHRIVYIRGSAPGASKFETPLWTAPYGWTNVAVSPSNLPITLTELQRVNFGYNGTFDGETINQGIKKNLKGWNSVTVTNTIIDGTSDITARQEINISNEFHASNTSEVHIFTSDAFIECDLLPSFLRVANNNAVTEPTSISSQKAIEVSFSKKQESDFVIIPNPNSGMFNLEISNYENGNTIISIKDPLGIEKKKLTTVDANISLTLHNFPKGVYFVEAIIGSNKIVKKLIIQ